MDLYGLKNCDTCRKAMKSLKDVRFLDVRVDGVPASLLEQAFSEFGTALMNTRSTTWRQLTESERERPVLELLTEHPTLMKRPLIVEGDKLYLGWTAQTKTALGVA